MNNTKLRQRLAHAILQDPSCDNPEIIILMQQDVEFKNFVLGARQQQQALKQALSISTPATLSAELMQLPQHAKSQNKWFIHLAITASLAIVSVFSAVIYTNANQYDMASHALAHVHKEANFVDSHLVQQPLAEVNAKLASFNISLDEWSDDIVYARFCDFKGIRSLHLAIRTATGYATVFIVPKDSELDFIPRFSDTDYQGLSLALAQANVVIVSREPTDLNSLPQKLLSNLRFSA